MKKDKNLALKGISAFLIYFLVTKLQALPFLLLGIDIKSLSKFVTATYTIVIELIIILSIFLLFKDYIIKCFKNLKKNHKEYFKKYFKYWFLMYGLMVLSNGIIMLLFKGTGPNNQDVINEMFTEMPVYVFILSVMLAPIIEEFAFRLSFRAMFKNKFLFILLSGLVFGSFHVIPLFESVVDLLYIIPYSIPGFIFAYTLYKSDNIFVPMGLHLFHNGISMSMQIILLLFT